MEAAHWNQAYANNATDCIDTSPVAFVELSCTLDATTWMPSMRGHECDFIEVIEQAVAFALH